MSSEIRLLLVDDHPMYRRGVGDALAIENDIKVIGEVGDACQAVAVAIEKRVDVVLMDVRMPVGPEPEDPRNSFSAATATEPGLEPGVWACGVIKERFPECHVVMLTTFVDPTIVVSAVLHGADGFLLKTAGRSQIVSAIRSAVVGEAPYAAEITPYVVRYARAGVPPSERTRGALLTGRELEVLRMLTQGMTNQEIAVNLGISIHTTVRHVSNILMKLNVRNRTEAVLFAVANRILSGL